MFVLRGTGLIAVFSVLVTSVLAQDRSSEEAEAKITDPAVECTPYYYPPSDQYIHKFPPVWAPAKLLNSDTEGQAMWSRIQGSIPNIPPKGQLDDSTRGVNYDDDADPDCWWTATQCTQPKHAGIPHDLTKIPEPRTLGYTFDDGPNCSHNAFYNYLASQNQKATMFYIGSNVIDWPLEAQRALADGHQICMHSWSHNYMTAFKSKDAFAELWYGLQAIKVVTGVTPTCWRPPYGDVDDRIRAIANAMGLRTMLWGYDSEDWSEGQNGVTKADIDNKYQQFIGQLTAGKFNKAGAVLLAHELNQFTMQEAIDWYPRLKSSFSHIVPIGVALNTTNPYLESGHTLPTFNQYISGKHSRRSGSERRSRPPAH